MMQGVLDFQDGFGNISKMLVLSYLRPFAFTLVFAGFSWAAINTGLLRSAFALAITLPVVLPRIGEYVTTTNLPQDFELIAIGVKETLIGMSIGYIASIPFAICTSAGGIIDMYRGSSDPSPDPSGGSGSPYGTAFQIMNLWIFAAYGGLTAIIAVIYESYRTWPLLEMFPGGLDKSNLDALIFVVQAVSFGAIVMAGPMVLLMFAIDMFVGLGGKVAPRLQFNGLDMLLKNLMLALVMPFYLTVLVGLMRSHTLELNNLRDLMEKLTP